LTFIFRRPLVLPLFFPQDLLIDKGSFPFYRRFLTTPFPFKTFYGSSFIFFWSKWTNCPSPGETFFFFGVSLRFDDTFLHSGSFLRPGSPVFPVLPPPPTFSLFSRFRGPPPPDYLEGPKVHPVQICVHFCRPLPSFLLNPSLRRTRWFLLTVEDTINPVFLLRDFSKCGENLRLLSLPKYFMVLSPTRSFFLYFVWPRHPL